MIIVDKIINTYKTLINKSLHLVYKHYLKIQSKHYIPFEK